MCGTTYRLVPNNFVLSSLFSAASHAACTPAQLERLWAEFARHRGRGTPSDTVFTSLLVLCQRSEEYTQYLLLRLADLAAPDVPPPAQETALRGGPFSSGADAATPCLLPARMAAVGLGRESRCGRAALPVAPGPAASPARAAAVAGLDTPVTVLSLVQLCASC